MFMTPFAVNCLRRSFSSKASNVRYYDVVISGGGLVGAMAACAIASDPVLRSCRILLVEPRQPKLWENAPERFSNRVYSITPGTKKLFENVSAWPVVENLRYKSVKRLHVWETASDASISFGGGSSGNVSYIVEDEVLSTALWKRIRLLREHIDVIHNAIATSYNIPSRRHKLHKIHNENGNSDTVNEANDYVQITLSDGQQIEASLLIGADGSNSQVRRSMGVKYLSWDYEQKGIVATMHLSEPLENAVGWQRFTPFGPIALLPLDNERLSLIWTTQTERADHLMRLPEDQFVDALNRALWDDADKNVLANAALKLMGNGVLSPLFAQPGLSQMPPSITGMDPNSRASFPLGLGHSLQYVVPRVALIGDAAHRVHPLAGLGVNLGFGDVATLINHLKNAVSCGEELSAMPYLLRYESDSQKRVVPVMTTTDFLNRLYSTSFGPVVLLRSLGLVLVNSCNPLKKQIMNAASR